MKLNKQIIAGSLAASLLVFLGNYSSKLGLCADTAYQCREIANDLAKTSFFFFLIFLFSTTTYLISQTVFNTWWKFASFCIPVFSVLLLFINLGLLQGDHYGSYGFGSLYDKVTEEFFNYAILSFFSIGSLIQIWRGYKIE